MHNSNAGFGSYISHGVTALKVSTFLYIEMIRYLLLVKTEAVKRLLYVISTAYLNLHPGKVLLYGTITTQQKVGEMSRKVGYVFQNPSHQMFCTTVRRTNWRQPRKTSDSPQETKGRS